MSKPKIEPLPCLCGAKPLVLEQHWEDYTMDWIVGHKLGHHGQIQHSFCVSGYKTRIGAIKAWNRLVGKAGTE